MLPGADGELTLPDAGELTVLPDGELVLRPVPLELVAPEGPEPPPLTDTPAPDCVLPRLSEPDAPDVVGDADGV